MQKNSKKQKKSLNFFFFLNEAFSKHLILNIKAMFTNIIPNTKVFVIA